MTVRRTLIALMMLLTAVVPVTAQQDGARLLSDTRWQEQAFGVSLLPPLDCKLIEQTGDDYLLRMVNQDVPYQITVAVKRSRSAQKLNDIAELSKVQILNAQGSAKLLDAERLKVADLDAVRLYYEVVPPNSTKAALIGQTIVEVNPFTFCVIQVEGAATEEKTLRSTYQAVTDSLEIADQQAMAKRREEAITRADQWRNTLTEQKIAAALKADQYYRITEDNKDIGWMHMTSVPGQFNNVKGFRIAVQTMIQLPTGRLDTKAEYFTPYDSPIGEAWSVVSTFRPTNATQPPRTSREIGTGATDQIEIRIDGTNGVATKNFQFARPPVGYLPQAQQWLLPQLLPHQAAGEFGFYCYNSATEQLAYRSDRVTPTLTGFQLTTRQAPNSPELNAAYNARGTLVEKDLGNRRKLIGSNLRELEPLWKSFR